MGDGSSDHGTSVIATNANQNMQTPNPNFDEKKYISAFAPLLAAKGWSAHFIIDQGEKVMPLPVRGCREKGPKN